MFITLLKKELREQSRTRRLLIYLAAFALIGLLSPLIAKYTPLLLKSIPDVPPELAAIFPAPTLKDVLDQYAKNFSQIGLLLVIVLSMGVVAQEKERGTLGMLFAKPVQRPVYLVTKWLSQVSSLLAGLLIAALGCWLYTFILFEAMPIGRFLAMNVLLAIFLGTYLTLALCASALARTQAAAAGLAFAAVVLLVALSAIPALSQYMPGRLLAWGWSLVMGGEISAWPALAASLSLIGFALLAAALHLESEEL